MKILICPLDWGLGHAARDVAIIQGLQDAGHEVILAGDGGTLELLRSEFPKLENIRFPSLVRIRYSSHIPAWLKITLLSPLLLYEVFTEHFRLGTIIRQLQPDIVISDNRYGLWNRKVRSILVSHQLSIRLPQFARFLEYPVYHVLRMFIGKFDQCWIPDFPEENNLSGNLSHHYPLPGNAVFIGVISRFSGSYQASEARDVTPPELLILLSGPEPQRSILQKIVLKQVLSLKTRCVILQGLPGKSRRTDLSPTVTMYNHLPSAELKHLLLSAGCVICRAGYTGIMDLAIMQKKALIIPTPGQTEQEYLAEYLSDRAIFLTCKQDDLDIESALEDLNAFEPELELPGRDLLTEVIRKM